MTFYMKTAAAAAAAACKVWKAKYFTHVYIPVLTEMRSSSCIKDVRLMKKLHKGIKDCDGTLLRTAIATKLEGKLNNQTFCQ